MAGDAHTPEAAASCPAALPACYDRPTMDIHGGDDSRIDVLGQRHFDRAARDCRGPARRVVSVLNDAERVPVELPEAIRLLAGAVDALRDELAAGAGPLRTRDRATAAAGVAGAAYRAGVGFSGGVTDLLRATGLEQTAAESVVRRAASGTGAGDP